MPWPLISLRDRRRQVRDSIATNLRGADATVPNSRLRTYAEAQAALTHDNDLHLDWVARMMMPDTAEGEFAERWANIWLPQGRKGATFSAGSITVTGNVGAVVPTGALLTATVFDVAGAAVTVEFEVVTGVTLASSSASVQIAANTSGALGNLEEGAKLGFLEALDGIDGEALIAAPGLAGGADQEIDADLVSRYIDRIQEPAHGGNANDYRQWMLEVPGVTRAWARQEMGIGTVTCRFMMDNVRSSFGGFPQTEDIDLVAAYIDGVRPVTVADRFVVAPIAQPFNLTISLIANDTPEIRTNVRTELLEMLRARAAPGGTIYASWIRESISSATGEDHHDTTVANQVASSAGHLITLGTITYS
jgi:uncharacterized phage protein gp47/JayE